MAGRVRHITKVRRPELSLWPMMAQYLTQVLLRMNVYCEIA
jgi:hypothetical protein